MSLNLLEITAEDIALLNEGDFHELIGRLCEADYRYQGLSTRGITWGGNSKANDGGIDVMVWDEITPPKASFIPRNKTGFQVKTESMHCKKIKREMVAKNGELKPKIKSLCEIVGAYIIVSSKDSISGTALDKRIRAMHEVFCEQRITGNIQVDFYDSNRVATWLRSHPSLILWIRNKIGKPLFGWQGYGNWANAPKESEKEYLYDDNLKLHLLKSNQIVELTISEGVQKLRSSLSTPQKTIRLVGWSGIGKTRLAQALFDERVGENALDPSQVYYTNVSDSIGFSHPEPEPTTFAEQLKIHKIRAILIVDNCTSKLHRALTEICSKEDSNISLLTVEHDVRENIPEKTDVYCLQEASELLISKLIIKCYSSLSQLDAERIARFAGGNAGIAMILAKNVKEGESYAQFNDEELLCRLIYQSHPPDESLMDTAKILSLVYSFDGENTLSDDSELNILGSLIGKTGRQLSLHANKLKSRGIIQVRGQWRAVLPHALSNVLAARALDIITFDHMESLFFKASSERLLKSFTRRLSFLHDSSMAVNIVENWLVCEGWLGKKIEKLNKYEISILSNIAPVSPQSALNAIERAANKERNFTSRENPHFYEFAQILRHIAYEARYFERCVDLLSRFALTESLDEKNYSICQLLKSLFYLHLSCTHATLAMRAKIIEKLVHSKNREKQELALFLLEATLETNCFNLLFDIRFGGRRRDYGYKPVNVEEVHAWYKEFIRITCSIALSESFLAERAKKILANKFRGLWNNAQVYDCLETMVDGFLKQAPWGDGWLSVCETIRFKPKNLAMVIVERLMKLEIKLRPKSLVESVKAYISTDKNLNFSLEILRNDEGEVSHSNQKMENKIKKMGARLPRDQMAFKTLLPEIVQSKSFYLYHLGQGLAEGCEDREKIWQALKNQLEILAIEIKNVRVFCGFLAASNKIDPDFCDSILNELVDDPTLGDWFPDFQVAAGISKKALVRFHKLLDAGRVSVRRFAQLAYGRVHETISDDELAILLDKIIMKDYGTIVVTEILKMRAYTKRKENKNFSEKLKKIGLQVLLTYDFANASNHSTIDYDLARISEMSIEGEMTYLTNELYANMRKILENHSIFKSDFPDLLATMSRLQPKLFLDIFLESSMNESNKNFQNMLFRNNDFDGKNNPLNHISDKEIISWCDKSPYKRYDIISKVIWPIAEKKETGKLAWKRIVNTILKRAPVIINAISNLSETLKPMAWEGSRADILQKRMILFDELLDNENPEVKILAKEQKEIFEDLISDERKFEAKKAKEARRHVESFE